MTKCCVEGCESSYTNTTHLLHSVSFHVFPRKIMLREKWAEAIGRPGWNPPVTTHVCSRHFSSKQMITSDNQEYKIKKDGYPDYALPKKSFNGEQQNTLKVCRFCLATNVKMYSLDTKVLRACVVWLQEKYNQDDLPQYACYICTAYLLKMYNVVEKSMIAQTMFWDIYSISSELTESCFFKSNRKKLNLAHSLQSHNKTPCKVYEYVYDENLNTSVLTSTKLVSDSRKDVEGKDDMIDFEVFLTATKLSKKLTHNITESEDLLTDTYCKSNHVEGKLSKTQNNSKATELNNQHGKKLLIPEHDWVRIYLNKSDSNIKGTKKNILIHDHIIQKGRNEADITIKDTNKKIRVPDCEITRLYDIIKVSNETDIKIKNAKSKMLAQEQNMIRKDTKMSHNVNIKHKIEMLAYENDHDYFRVYSEDELGVPTDNIVENTTPRVLETEIKNIKSVRFASLKDNVNEGNVTTPSEDETMSSIEPMNAIEGSHKTNLKNDFHIMKVSLQEQKHHWPSATGPDASSPALQQCGVCSRWVHRQTYAEHVEMHDPYCGAFACEICKMRYTSEGLLKRHVQKHHSRKYICKLCSDVFYTHESARTHGLQHRRRGFHCTLCPRVFCTRVNLGRHVSRIHGDALPPSGPAEASETSEPEWRSTSRAPSIGSARGAKKRQKSKLTASEGRIVYNVFKHFKRSSVRYPFKSRLFKKTAQITGLSLTAVQKVVISIEKAELKTTPSEPRLPESACSTSDLFTEKPTNAMKRIMFNLYQHVKKTSASHLVKEDLYKTTAQIMGMCPTLLPRTIKEFEESQIHPKRKKSKKRVVCPACKRWFQSRWALRSHQASCPGKPVERAQSVKCSASGSAEGTEGACGAGSERRSTRLKQKVQFQSRNQPNRMPPIEVVYECPACGEAFKTLYFMKKHLKGHQQMEITKFGESQTDITKDGVAIISGTDTEDWNVRDDNGDTDTKDWNKRLNCVGADTKDWNVRDDSGDADTKDWNKIDNWGGTDATNWNIGDVSGGTDTKDWKLRDDSETDTCSEGEELNNQLMADSADNGRLPMIYY